MTLLLNYQIVHFAASHSRLPVPTGDWKFYWIYRFLLGTKKKPLYLLSFGMQIAHKENDKTQNLFNFYKALLLPLFNNYLTRIWYFRTGIWHTNNKLASNKVIFCHVNAVLNAKIDYSRTSNIEDYMIKWVMNYLILKTQVLLEIIIVDIKLIFNQITLMLFTNSK